MTMDTKMVEDVAFYLSAAFVALWTLFCVHPPEFKSLEKFLGFSVVCCVLKHLIPREQRLLSSILTFMLVISVMNMPYQLDGWFDDGRFFSVSFSTFLGTVTVTLFEELEWYKKTKKQEEQHRKGPKGRMDCKDRDETTAAEKFLAAALICDLSLERMKDPVILFCTDPSKPQYGHIYEKEIICQSLVAHPSLDPKSNVRYTARLFYVPCRILQDYLKSKDLYQAYDDSTFATDYERAWNRLQRAGGRGIQQLEQEPQDEAPENNADENRVAQRLVAPRAPRAQRIAELVRRAQEEQDRHEGVQP